MSFSRIADDAATSGAGTVSRDSDDDMRFMVCLYGVALDKAEILPLLGEVHELMRATGQATTHVSVDVPGFGQKPLLFPRAWKRLQRAAPVGLVSVNLGSPKGRVGDLDGDFALWRQETAL
jgi:hypothetical protein